MSEAVRARHLRIELIRLIGQRILLLDQGLTARIDRAAGCEIRRDLLIQIGGDAARDR